jgi:PAS domain S-box-containing protein
MARGRFCPAAGALDTGCRRHGMRRFWLGVPKRHLRTGLASMSSPPARVRRAQGTLRRADVLPSKTPKTSDERYRLLVDQMQEGVAYCQMLFDDVGQPSDWIYLDVNPVFEPLTGMRDVVGKRVTELIPGVRAANPELFDLYGRVTTTGIPERFETYVPGLERWFSIKVFRPSPSHFAAVFENITDHKLVDEALREGQQRYAAVVDNLVDGVVVQDAGGRIVASNPAARAILGLNVDELTGLTSFDPDWQAVWADGSPARGEDHPATIARTTGRPVAAVVMGVRHSSGMTRWLNVNAQPLRDASGAEVTGAVVSFRDVSDALRSEQALRDSEAILNQTQALMRVGGWAFDVASETVSWTDEVYRIHDLTRDYDPNSAQRDIEFYAPEDRARIAEAFRLVVQEGLPYDLVARLNTAQGREIWVRTLGQPQLRDGRVDRIYGTIADITEQRRADEELRVAHARLRRFIDANLIGVVIGGAGGTIVEANDYYLGLIGYTRGQLDAGAIDWRAIRPPEWLPVSEQGIEQRERGVSTPYEKEYVRPDASRVPVLVGGSTLPGPGEEIAAFAIDISDLKKAQGDLEESERRLSEAQDLAQLGSWRWDVKTGDVEWSDQMFRIFQLDPRTFKPHIDSILDLSPWPEDHERDQELIRRAMEHREKGTYEQRFLRPDKSIGYYHSTFQGHYDDAGNLVTIIGTALETTQRKRAELDVLALNAELEGRVQMRTAALQAANQELEAFSYSVSHDLRSPLRSIDGFCQILLSEHAEQLDSEARRVLGIVVRNARQMGILIDDLLAFSGVARKEFDRRPVDMEHLARSVFDELCAAAPERAIAFDVGPLARVSGDQALLRQVWVNLLGNAVKFTGPVEQPRIEVRCEPISGECRYTVHDNGVGFDPLYADKLFRPFQRLHASSEFEGTGIGLAIVARIVQRHDGRVWAEGSPGVGATFGFSLPEHQEET